jgi:hypothetical protein
LKPKIGILQSLSGKQSQNQEDPMCYK